MKEKVKILTPSESVKLIREDYLKKFDEFMQNTKLENVYVGTISGLRHKQYKGTNPIPSKKYIKWSFVEPYIDGVIEDGEGKWCTIQSNMDDDFLVRVDSLSTRDLVRLYKELVDVDSKKKNIED